MVDLNKFDEERFETEEAYQDEVRSTPVGVNLEILATSMTLQDVGEFLGFVQPELLKKFFVWAEKNYPELDIDPEAAERLVKETITTNDHAIINPITGKRPGE